MMLLLVLFFSCLAVDGALAGLTTRSTFQHVLKEKHHVPQGWSKIGDAPASTRIALRIALRQGNFEKLERNLLDVSNPSSKNYGKHLSAAQVQDLVRPSAKTQDLVHSWLEQHGHAESVEYSPAKDWAKLTLPLEEVERLLDTQYSVYRHEDGTELVRTTQWSLPAYLHNHIDAIQPTNSFFRFKPNAVQWLASPSASDDMNDVSDTAAQDAVAATDLSSSDIESVCNTTKITPECLSTLYGTKGYTPKLSAKSKIGYCNYLEETTISTDLAMFLDTYRPEASGANVKIQIVNNGQNQQVFDSTKLAASSDVEGNLDGQTIMGMVWPMPVMAYNTGGRPTVSTPYNPPAGQAVTNEPYMDWLDYMQGLSDSEIPPTISTSYGDDEQSVPPEYAQRVCQSFAQLGSRGVTLLFSSGDSGVGSHSPTSDRCEIYPNPEVAANAVANFMPAFPASCPYVTTVGATKGVGTGSFSKEVAAGYPANQSSYASGGGFSNYFARPAWQDSVVTNYMNGLSSAEVDPSMYNHSGRAYPDVAANGQHYSIMWNKQLISVDGTSASSPTMASVIALLNDDLIASGRSPLGFMNPWLYSVGKAGFTDIISGSAKGCGVDGFPAKTGWDAVSGFGTPVKNFVQLQKLAIQNENTAPGSSQSGYIDQGRRVRGSNGWSFTPRFF